MSAALEEERQKVEEAKAALDIVSRDEHSSERL